MKYILSVALIVIPFMTAEAGLFGNRCLIESPVRNLNVDDMSPKGFSVEWAPNHGDEIPIDLRVTMNGADATPDIPWWMMLFDKGAGMSNAVHGVVPGARYVVEVSQKSICGTWSSESIVVNTPVEDNTNPTIDQALAEATSRVNEEVALAPENVDDVNDEYGWTETLACEEDDISCVEESIVVEAAQRDDLNIWDQRNTEAKIDSIMDDGQRTFIRTNDLSEVAVYELDGEDLVPVPVEYDQASGVTSFPGDPRDYVMFVGDYEVQIGDNSNNYGSAPNSNYCDPVAGSCV